jgi:hypothetical protein
MAEFSLTPISKYGTATPAVARAVIQTQQLMQAFPITNEQREAILGIAFAFQRHLLACEEIGRSVIEEIEVGKERVRKGLPTQSGGRFVELPSVLDLETRAESFLYQAKLGLRDIAGLIKPFVGRHFDENFKKFLDWAKTEWGSDDEIVAMLETDRPWIAQVIDMRNGVEHPTHKAGPLKIENFRLVQGPNGQTVAEPTWRQGRREPTSIANDIGTICHNLLTLFEELLVAFLLKLASKLPFGIAEIPEDSRDPAVPIRFRVVLTAPLPSPEA